MDFDTLLNYCLELNNSTSEKCLVCHIPIENSDPHLKLKCKHLFHSNCISYKSGKTKCLYCEVSSVPEIINQTNKTLKPSQIVNPIKSSETHCKVLLKSGSNAGQFCNRVKCPYHKIQTQKVIVVNSPTKKSQTIKQNKKIIKTDKCIVILKTGQKSGQVCGRNLPCKYHNKISDNSPSNKINNNQINQVNQVDTFTNLVTEEQIDLDEELIEV